MGSVTLSKTPPQAEPGYTIGTFPKALQEQFLEAYRRQYPVQPVTVGNILATEQEVYTPPSGYNAHVEHHKIFWDAVRRRRPVVEDAVFGLQAAGPALACNVSYFDRRVVAWDPEKMTDTN